MEILIWETENKDLMMFYFWKGINAVQTAKNISTIYGNGAILLIRWIRGNFDLESQELYAVLDDERKKSASCYSNPGQDHYIHFHHNIPEEQYEAITSPSSMGRRDFLALTGN